MKKLVKVLLALLPFIAVSVMAAPAQKSPTKQRIKQTKNTSVKKQSEKKLVVKATSTKKAVDKKAVKAKNAKKTVENKKALQKKTAAKANQKKGKKQVSIDKKSAKSAMKSASRKDLNNAKKTTLAQAKKGEKTENNAAKALPLSQAKKMVVVPKCQDDNVVKVLSDAFKQQGKATGVPMTVKQLSQARETQHYPQQGIRSCHALVETNGKKYQTDYSVILNGNSFFVQVENAQSTF